MALNWQAHKNLHADLLNITWKYGRTENHTIHPILHRLIFLTMRLGCDLTKNQQDVVNRVSVLRRIQPDLVTITFGSEAEDTIIKHGDEWIPFLKYYPNAVKTANGWSVAIDEDWVIRYWGLSTNAARVPFKKWANRELKAITAKAA